MELIEPTIIISDEHRKRSSDDCRPASADAVRWRQIYGFTANTVSTPACGRESRTESEIHKYSRNAKCRQPLPHTATIRENTLKRPSGRTSFYFFSYMFLQIKKYSYILLITIYRLNSRKPLRARLRGHLRHNTHPVRKRKIARRTARTYSNRFFTLNN